MVIDFISSQQLAQCIFLLLFGHCFECKCMAFEKSRFDQMKNSVPRTTNTRYTQNFIIAIDNTIQEYSTLQYRNTALQKKNCTFQWIYSYIVIHVQVKWLTVSWSLFLSSFISNASLSLSLSHCAVHAHCCRCRCCCYCR